MALTRKFLSALGIEADKVDEIIEAHAETVNALKAERDEFKSSATKAEELEKELKEAKEQLEQNGSDSYKVKYEAIKEEFETFKTEQNNKAILDTKRNEYISMLKESGVSEKRIDSIMKVTDVSKLELDENNKLKDAETITKTIKEEWSDFIITDNKKGADTDTGFKGEDGEKPPVSIPTIF